MIETLDNKTYLTQSLLGTGREGMEDLIGVMEAGGFFEMPCSGGHHLCTEYGLICHTVNVLKTAEKLGVCLLGGDEYNKVQNSVIIAAGLHDLGKMGQFDKPGYVYNYLKSGNLSTDKPFKVNPDLLSVPHEIRSVAIAQMYIDLTEEEQFAILYHNGLYGPLKYEIQGKETSLYMLLHWADMWASREMEGNK